MSLWLMVLVGLAAAQNPPVPSDIPDSRYTPEAIAEIRSKAEAGNAQAQVVLGQAYEEGNGVPKNEVTAATWYRKAAEQGNAEGQNNLGIMYRMGSGVDQDKAEAVRWYLKAAKQGYGNAYFNIATAYYNGDGVTADFVRACAWFIAAQEAGSDTATEAMQRTIRELRKDNIVDCYFTAGQVLEDGQQAKPQPQRAVYWYEKAGDMGSSVAVWRVADMMARGSGMAPDAVAAAHLRDKALAMDRGPVMVEYGNRLRTGNGATQDLHAAFEMYRKAAELYHYPPAMLNVGLMYAEGMGCDKNLVTGYSWIFGASLNSRDEIQAAAQRALAILDTKMTPADIKRARKDFGERVGGDLNSQKNKKKK